MKHRAREISPIIKKNGQIVMVCREYLICCVGKMRRERAVTILIKDRYWSDPTQ